MVPIQFAQLVAVNPSTLHRWEHRGAAEAGVEPLQLKLLTALKQQLEARRTTEERKRFAQALLTGMLVGGGLFGIYKLLQAVFDDGPGQRETRGPAARPTVGRTKRPPSRRKKASS